MKRVRVCNPLHAKVIALELGEGLPTRVNANIGTSQACNNLDLELQKLEICHQYKADAVMDLSTGGDIASIRRAIIANTHLPLGTVPIYQSMIENRDIFEVIEEHAKDGVDFVTVHCGVTFESIGRLKKNPRLMEVVSRGGAMLMDWVLKNKKENSLYAHYDYLLEIAAKYNLTLSLGDGMRPGCIADAGDPAQIQELIILGDLTQRAWKAGVQVIIEGPGHVPYNQIEAQIKMAKEICKGAPFYVLGPIPTDVAPGYDHITSAIGGTLAAVAGADFLCYVTPSEHIGLPSLEDVKQGIISARIAAHIADIVKGIPGAKEWDNEMSKARKALDWKKQQELAIDPSRFQTRDSGLDTCSMCGEYCSMKISSQALKE